MGGRCQRGCHRSVPVPVQRSGCGFGQHQGMVSSSTTGDTFVVVFYDNAVAPVSVLHPLPESQSRYPANTLNATHTEIDRLVIEKLNKPGITRSPVADDATFLRRITLDITGTLPTADEVRQFLADGDPDKRSNKINRLLRTPAYAATRTTFLCDMTGNNSIELNRVRTAGRGPRRNGMTGSTNELMKMSLMTGLSKASSCHPVESRTSRTWNTVKRCANRIAEKPRGDSAKELRLSRIGPRCRTTGCGKVTVTEPVAQSVLPTHSWASGSSVLSVTNTRSINGHKTISSSSRVSSPARR